MFPDDVLLFRATCLVPPTTAHVPGRRLMFLSDVSWLFGRRLVTFRTTCYVPDRHVMFPHSVFCSQTACHVPERRLVFPDDLWYREKCNVPPTTCYVPGQRLLFPDGVSCSWTSSCVPGWLFMGLEKRVMPSSIPFQTSSRESTFNPWTSSTP